MKIKKLLSIILILVLSVMMCQFIYASEEVVSEEEVTEEEVTEEEDTGEDVFEAAQIQAEEAEGSGDEFEGFIFKVEDTESIDESVIPEIELIDEEEGLYVAESIEAIAEVVPEEQIQYIEPDYTMELFTADNPNDSYYRSDHWNITDVNAQSLWKAGIEGQDLDSSVDMNRDGNSTNDKIVVAVIDSGLNISHEDIDSSRVTGAWNVISSNSDVTDKVGHGTFVTGEIMATKDNGVGVAGYGQSIYVMPIKAFDSETAQTSSVTSAILYAVSQKNKFDSSGGASGANVCVINISFGGSNTTTALKSAVDSAINAGIIVVCAAGNDGGNAAIYPAMYAIGVGSYGKSGSVSSFSRRLSADNGSGYENKVWVCAPGENITSAYKGSNSAYETKSGTSFAAPAVSALAAICKGIDNSLDHYSFRQILKNTATSKSSGLGTINGQDIGFGWGTVDFVNTVNAVLGYPIIESGTNGLSNNTASDGNYHYYKNGVIDFGFTGLTPNNYGWWKVVNGKSDFSCNSVEPNEYGWWYVENGRVNFDYTGIKPNEYGWWRIVNGCVDFSFTGLAPNEYGWWYLEGGCVRFDYYGIKPNEAGWWKITGGNVEFGFTGLAPNEYGWWYLENGLVNFGYTGIKPNEYGWWRIVNGNVDFGFTGLASNEYGWWYLEGGCVNFNYTGTYNGYRIVNGNVVF